MSSNRKLITVKEAADLIGVATGTIHNYLRSGVLKSYVATSSKVSIGRGRPTWVYLDLDDVNRLIAARDAAASGKNAIPRPARVAVAAGEEVK
jgi:predicted ArsR family transcriptional regulator